MKKLLPLAFIILTSCAPKIYPLKGNYPTTPIVYISEKPIDHVWSNIIDLFAQKGIPIKLIDKSSGLIISEPAALSWSLENKTGDLMNKGAWVALAKTIDPGNQRPIKPSKVIGSWNIRIKDVNGKTSVNVNLYDIRGFMPTAKEYANPVPLSGKTTGNFEKLIYENINS